MKVWVKDDTSSAFFIDASEYATLRSDWMSGKAFWTGKNFYGAEITIKLGAVVAILLDSPASVAQADADRKEERRLNAIEGGE